MSAVQGKPWKLEKEVRTGFDKVASEIGFVTSGQTEEDRRPDHSVSEPHPLFSLVTVIGRDGENLASRRAHPSISRFDA